MDIWRFKKVIGKKNYLLEKRFYKTNTLVAIIYQNTAVSNDNKLTSEHFTRERVLPSVVEICLCFIFKEETYTDNAQGLDRNISDAAEIKVHKKNRHL